MKRVKRFNEIDEEAVIIIKNLGQTIPEGHTFEYTVAYRMRDDEEVFEVLGLTITLHSYVTLRHIKSKIKITLYEDDLEWCEMFEDDKSSYPQYFV